MIKIAWLSRHPMSEEQLSDLVKGLGVPTDKVEVVTVNHTWQATHDADADLKVNGTTWDTFSGEYNLICGVFPPVALEALAEREGGCVYTPVSEQNPVTRADGSKAIEFKHVRWATLS